MTSKGNSSATAIIQALKQWTKCIDEGESVVVLFRCSQASIRVQHKLLLYKMNILGVGPRAISWTKPFLSGRKFDVRVNFSFSSTIRSGEPQEGTSQFCSISIFTLNLLSDTDAEFCAFVHVLTIYRSISNDADVAALQNAIV